MIGNCEWCGKRDQIILKYVVVLRLGVGKPNYRKALFRKDGSPGGVRVCGECIESVMVELRQEAKRAENGEM